MCGKKKRPVVQAKAEKKAKRPPAAKAGRLSEFSLFLPKGGAKARPQGQAEKEIVCLACGSGDDEEGNEILICAHEKSGRCGGAYHQRCLSPPVLQASSGLTPTVNRDRDPQPNPNSLTLTSNRRPNADDRHRHRERKPGTAGLRLSPRFTSAVPLSLLGGAARLVLPCVRGRHEQHGE